MKTGDISTCIFVQFQSRRQQQEDENVRCSVHKHSLLYNKPCAVCTPTVFTMLEIICRDAGNTVPCYVNSCKCLKNCDLDVAETHLVAQVNAVQTSVL